MATDTPDPDPAAEVVRLLALLQRQLAEIERLCRLEAIEAPVVSRLGDPGLLLRGLLSLSDLQAEFEVAQRGLAASAGAPIGALTPQLRAFLERDHPRIFEHVGEKILIMIEALFEMGEQRVVVAAFRQRPVGEERLQSHSASRHVRWLIGRLTADLIEDLQRDGEEPGDHVKMAAILARAGFFQPDAWWNNWCELRPVLASRQVGHFPLHVRLALREAYHSYIFGNGLAVAALCRSILEAALIERGTPLGIETRTSYKGKPTSRRLSELVEDLARRMPELREPLDLVVDYGNDVLHPTRRPDILPSSVPVYATRALEALRLVLEKIYSL